MAGDRPRQPWLTRRAELTLGLKVLLGVGAVVAAGLGCVLGLPVLVVACAVSGTHSGTAIDAERARRIVVEQSDVLRRVLALAAGSPRPSRDDPAGRALARELGALDIRFEAPNEGSCVRIAFSRGGLPETYETQLAWAPAAVAERVRAGEYRLGEAFEQLDDGWWWVWW